MARDIIISFKVDTHEMELIKECAHYRFLMKAMEHDTVSDYIRALLHRDIDDAMQSIHTRRRGV